MLHKSVATIKRWYTIDESIVAEEDSIAEGSVNIIESFSNVSSDYDDDNEVPLSDVRYEEPYAWMPDDDVKWYRDTISRY